MIQITDADKPDPVSGRQASARYAQHWVQSHKSVADDVAYRVGYIDLIVIDQMLMNYTMLDVGCGTGGYLRLIKNYRSITGIDFSEAMIDQARNLQIEFDLKNIKYVCAKFEGYEPDEPFDIIRMGGVVGWYRPWPGNEGSLAKAYSHLRSGGLVVTTYVPPANLIQAAKSVLFPTKTVVITRTKFLGMAVAAGFEYLFSIDAPNLSYAFLRKSN